MPEEPTYPLTDIRIVEQGAVINIMLSPHISISQMLSADMMDDLCKQWRQSRKQNSNQLEIIRHIGDLKVRT